MEHLFYPTTPKAQPRNACRREEVRNISTRLTLPEATPTKDLDVATILLFVM
jgi:hypothetical protein